MFKLLIKNLYEVSLHSESTCKIRHAENLPAEMFAVHIRQLSLTTHTSAHAWLSSSSPNLTATSAIHHRNGKETAINSKAPTLCLPMSRTFCLQPTLPGLVEDPYSAADLRGCLAEDTSSDLS